MYRTHIMSDRIKNHISNIVSFYDGNDICSSNNKNFVSGSYLYDDVKSLFKDSWKPKIVKIDAGTTLSVYFGPDTRNGAALNRIVKDDMIIYNNPYRDRFVVVKLPDKIITGFDIDRYTPSIERFEMDSSGVFFSTTDILIIIFLLLLLWMYRFSE